MANIDIDSFLEGELDNKSLENQNTLNVKKDKAKKNLEEMKA